MKSWRGLLFSLINETLRNARTHGDLAVLTVECFYAFDVSRLILNLDLFFFPINFGSYWVYYLLIVDVWIAMLHCLCFVSLL